MKTNSHRTFVAGSTKTRRLDQQQTPVFTDENTPEAFNTKKKGVAAFDGAPNSKPVAALSTATAMMAATETTNTGPKGALVDKSNNLRRKMLLAKAKASKQETDQQQGQQKQTSEDVKDFLEDNAKRYQTSSTTPEKKMIAPVPVLPIQVPDFLRSKFAAAQEKTTANAHTRQTHSMPLHDVGNKEAELSLPTETYTDKISQDVIDATLAYEKEQEMRARAIRTEDNVVADWNDPLLVDEYEEEIFEYLRAVEHETMADPSYASDHQHEITWKLRAVLIDWIVEVHYLFQLLPETLFLAVNIVDRFLSKRTISINKLQLVGIASLFIATKFEEVSSPRVSEFVFMTDNALTEADLIRAERFILQTLDFSLCYPHPLNFFRRIAKLEYHDVKSRTIAKYLMEISCLDHLFIGIPPSKVAAAAMWLTQRVLTQGSWDEKMVQVSGYTWPELKPVVRMMLNYLAQPVTHDAFFRKWAGKRMIKASVFVQDWVTKHYKCT